MDDKAFLKYALEQSFYHPLVNSAEGLSVQTEQMDTGFVLKDISHRELTDYILPHSQIKKYLKSVEYDTRHAFGLYAEYDLYKHDVRENIIIPEDFAPVATARRQLDLLTVNRQSAQKKRVCARIIPVWFAPKLKEIHLQYRQTMQNIEIVLSQNPDAVNLSILNDFVSGYKQMMRLCHFNHLGLWLNKKYFKYYLNEAAQILKSGYPLPEDFMESHKFVAENSLCMGKAARICKAKLGTLAALLQQLKNETPLLTLVQTLLADSQKFTVDLNTYRNNKKIADISKIGTLRHNAQYLFESYALLCYLNGVRFAFENKYLNECPEPRQPALPTVAPAEEIKKVERIVFESHKIDASNSKICRIYTSAVQNYAQIQQIITKNFTVAENKNVA